MQAVDLNYILDGQLQLFDYLFLMKIGIDSDKNYVYLVQDKYRDRRTAKFYVVNKQSSLDSQLTPFFILSSSIQCKYVQPIYDFTVSKQKHMVLLTMPVPQRSLYSVIKDTNINLRTRLSLARDVVQGVFYMHFRRKINAGQIRPQSILIYETSSSDSFNSKTKTYWMNSSLQTIKIHACLNNFCLLTQTEIKPEKWKWLKNNAQYYEAPQIWVQSEIKKKKDVNVNSTEPQSQPQQDYKTHEQQMQKLRKSQIWSTALVIIEIMSGKKIHELLQGIDILPSQLLKSIRNKQKMISEMKKRGGTDPAVIANLNQKPPLITSENFYQMLLRHIYNLRLKALLKNMLSFKPKKRPEIIDIYHTIEKLQVVDKINKNIRRITGYQRNMKNVYDNKQQCQNDNNKDKTDKQDAFDDKKSVISMKSVRSGKSIKSYFSETRKRALLDFPTLMNVRQQIAQVEVRPSNSLYRSYGEDCANRLVADENYAPPAIKLDLPKNDRLLQDRIKGQKDQDIKKWKLDQVTDSSSHQQLIPNKYGSSFNQNSNIYLNQQSLNWLTPARDQFVYPTQMEEQEKTKQELDFGPTKKKIPKNPTCYESGYNDNLLNFHYLGTLQLQRERQLATTVFRPENINNAQGPQKSAQFILNLKYSQLLQIPYLPSKLFLPPNCLKYLDISFNSIKSLASLTFDESLCINLLVLNVSHNKIAKIDAKFWKLTSLQQCFISNNQITQMRGFQDISSNDSTQMEDDCSKSVKLVNRCEKLKKLYMGENLIKHIENIYNLPQLEILSLRNNPLVEDEYNIYMMTKLKERKVQIYL